MSRRMSAALIVVVAAVVVSTAVAATAFAAEPGVSPPNTTGDADDAYVTDDGDVILVFNESNTAGGSGHLGVNVEEGLTYGLFEWSDVPSDVTGSLSMMANRTQVNASGAVATPRPDLVEELEFDLERVMNAETSTADMNLNATVGLPEDSRMLAAIFQNLDTSGEIRMTGTTLSSTGSADLTVMYPGIPAASYDLDLQATDSGHSLNVAQERTISGYAVEQWNTEARAEETIRRQLQSLSRVGAETSDFTLEEYSFERTEEGGQLSIAFSIHIDGLNEALRNAIAMGVASQPTPIDGSDAPRQEAIQSTLGDLAIERVDISVEMGSNGGSANWDVRVNNYDGLLRAYFKMMNTTSGGGLIENVSEQYENNRAAMEAAGFAQTTTWDLTVAPTDDAESITATATMQSRTDNWQAYINEREDRNLPPVGTQRAEVHVQAVEDRITGNASLLIRGADLYNRTLSMYEQSVQQAAASAGPTATPTLEQAIETVRTAGFLGARLDASVNESTARLEGGAAFENLTAFTNQLDVPVDTGSVQRAYVELGEDETQSFVRLKDAVSSDGDGESALRELSMVSEETTIHLANEWDADAKDFPSLDTAAVQAYVPDAHSEDETTESMPMALLAGGGLGVLAIIAVVGGYVALNRE